MQQVFIGKLAVYLSGHADDPLTILLHGFPDTPRSLLPLAETLAARGRRVAAPYLRGYAPSTLTGPHTIAQLAADALDLADALSPAAPVALCGHDWGAIATYAACAAAPTRIARAVTLAVPHPNAVRRNLSLRQLRKSWYMLFFQLRVVAERMLARRDFALVERLWRDWSPGLTPPAELLADVKRCLAASLPAPLGYYRSLRPQRAPKVAVPTLYLHGVDDGCVGVELGAGQERDFTGRFEEDVLSGAGHFVHVERPDEVARRVTAWLEAREPVSHL